MSVNRVDITSEASCRRAYLNYHTQGNSLGITSKEMGEITQAWKGKLASWQASVSNDDNRYEFDDSDFEYFRTSGKDKAKEETGDDGKANYGSIGSVAGSAALGAEMIVSAAGKGLGTALNKAGGAVAKNLAGTVAKKGAKKTAKESGKKALEKASWAIEAPLALAQATVYQVIKPNKSEKKACDELQNVMQDSQNALNETQEDLENTAEEIIALSDEATETNEDANKEIEDKKTEYDQYRTTYEELKAKVDSGKKLTDEEQALYDEIVESMKTTGEDISEQQEDTSETVEEIHSDMDSKQEHYDDAAETIGEIEGITDFAEGFDETTRTMCYVEASAQGLNAASGAKAGIQAGLAAAASMGFNIWAWACAGMGAAAAAMSSAGAAQQVGYAGDVGNEIHMRRDTQDFNATTLENYENELDFFATSVDEVGNLELAIPDDIEAPDDTEIPNQSSPYPNNTPESLKGDKKDKEPKES